MENIDEQKVKNVLQQKHWREKNKEKGTKMGVDYAVGGNVYNIKTLLLKHFILLISILYINYLNIFVLSLLIIMSILFFKKIKLFNSLILIIKSLIY